ncbi:MAG: D-alanyl-D-alanine carboxypeptidase [Ruminococcus sp.]|nr:D-alanyl-D-alanine carboxypeptidase [Ruminococcus sp.]
MRRKANRKGGAGVVAVLIMIIIVAVGSALMIVTGRSSIAMNDRIQTPMPEGYDTDETPTLQETEPAVEIIDEPIVPEEPETLVPVLADTYETIDISDAGFNTAVLLDADTNEILAGLKYNKKTYPASLTKLLTILVAAENIDDLNEKYTFTAEDIDPLIDENASRAGFEAGEAVTMEDLFYASILVSGGDGTRGLAMAVAGSEEEFTKMLNAKAAEMGLTDTNFVNASGLHDKQHYSTVQDIAVITRACLNNEICRKVLSTDTYTTSETPEHENGIVLESIFHSRYGGYYVDVDQDGEEDAELLGGKTGFTDEAMYTLSSVVTINGHDFICVITKDRSSEQATIDTIAIFEKYLPGSKVEAAKADESKAADEDSDDSSETEEDDGAAKADEDGVVVLADSSKDEGYED